MEGARQPGKGATASPQASAVSSAVCSPPSRAPCGLTLVTHLGGSGFFQSSRRHPNGLRQSGLTGQKVRCTGMILPLLSSLRDRGFQAQPRTWHGVGAQSPLVTASGR